MLASRSNSKLLVGSTAAEPCTSIAMSLACMVLLSSCSMSHSTCTISASTADEIAAGAAVSKVPVLKVNDVDEICCQTPQRQTVTNDRANDWAGCTTANQRTLTVSLRVPTTADFNAVSAERVTPAGIAR